MAWVLGPGLGLGLEARLGLDPNDGAAGLEVDPELALLLCLLSLLWALVTLRSAEEDEAEEGCLALGVGLRLEPGNE